MTMRRIAIFGSTGSIGVNALDVCRRYPKDFTVVALSANARTDVLLQQVEEFCPSHVAVADAVAAREIKKKLPKQVRLFEGSCGLTELISLKEIDRVVMAISGAAALPVVWAGLEAGKDIALANKESLVMAGALVMKKAKQANVKIIPIDSEQSAIWQCIQHDDRFVNRLHLTASGGPLRLLSGAALRNVSVETVLKHPRWSMGPKITVDSATLMNKGLELIESMFLFDVPAEKINVVIHPESIIHSMVEFTDGVVLAQLSVTDMRIPIQYALSYPKRLGNLQKPLDFFAVGSLNFEKPDLVRFPCLGMAYAAASSLGTAPAAMNAVNEVAVEAFLNRRVRFCDIPRVVETVMSRHRNISCCVLDDVYAADQWARDEAMRLCAGKRAQIKKR
jgi:1-deoxy-D-xylulose-5-phosphate reductoisomerase